MGKRFPIPSTLFTLLTLSAVSVLTACATPDRPNFANMSGEELATYNATVPYDQRVICRTDPALGSLLRRKTCLTYEEDYRDKRNQMELLRTVNSGPVNVDLR